MQNFHSLISFAQAINQEIELYNPKLANKTQVVVINKIDIPEVLKLLATLVSIC